MDVNGSKNELLNSWKEIARYLGRGIRTVQRWERELGLPIRRPRGKKRSAVIALPVELDAWATKPANRELDGAPGSSKPAMIPQPLRERILTSQGLRAKNRRLMRDVSVTLLSLLADLKRITDDSEPSSTSTIDES
jgi:hypothetical protein